MFPGMTDAELDALIDDIRRNGLRDPIVRYRGEIIDGRHRLQACIVAGVKPRFVEWDGAGSLVLFVASKNLHRRHLTTSQRAAVGAILAQQIEAERDSEPVNSGEKEIAHSMRDIPDEEETPKPKRGRGRPRTSGNADAAAAVGASVRSVQEARMVQAEDPELFDAVASGEVSLPEAAKQIRGGAPDDIEAIRGRALASLLDVERTLEALAEADPGFARDKTIATLFRLRSQIGGGKRSKKPAAARFDPAEVDLPEELATDEFRAKWREWCAYRSAKKKPVSAVAAARSLEKCRRAGLVAAMQGIDDAIAADWQGLFPRGVKSIDDRLAGVREFAASGERTGRRGGVEIEPGVELMGGRDESSLPY